jgi:tRNA pseudouridine38-40 synthase
MSNRIAIVFSIEYNGTQYSGWQKQQNGKSIQGIIEEALCSITSLPLSIIGSGRTDAGVHAKSQIAHTKLDLSDISIPIDKLQKALNSKLPKDIRINGLCTTTSDFHCTKHAVYREYSYTISTKESVFDKDFTTYIKYPIDEDKLFDIGRIFLGTHDFTSFSKNNPSTSSYVCDLSVCEWKQLKNMNYYRLHIGANRFVYAMVRSLTGTMIDYARGIITKEDILYRLENPSRNPSIRRSAIAPASGLVLEKIIYPELFGIHF